MIDYVEKIIPWRIALGVKYISENEWFLKCHIQRELAMPGTL